ncbi:hypothetical protein FHX42_003814 [Saccharopolyspora lacisalsi]|uniref:DNA primase/polymerase bifunctional N-terminal domain-containing protein n=1 Tax=Halosaccharopolyspora lacisalsi TaxID=1000566 RepID=A0A839E6C1_9PSEU|nr:bifunctional DNA primase/polymerase [Halosaccharopolyspora lacisalsi]MBA8826438.1 hypothetical protein [Halosaccharopolyspora lacisalsi]
MTRTEPKHPGGSLLPVIPGTRWTELRSAAVECARRSWPVLPGTYQLDERDGWWGRPGAAGLRPVAPPIAPDRALDRWTRRPCSVLLACGHSVDAVEVTAEHGGRALERLFGDRLGPVAASPSGCWFFFVSSNGLPMRTELFERAQVQHHARGCWLPLPPSSRDGLVYSWRVSPSSADWSLPSSAEVQQVLAETLPR